MHIMFPYLLESFTREVINNELILQILQYNKEMKIEDLYIKLAFTLGSFLLPKRLIKSFNKNKK